MKTAGIVKGCSRNGGWAGGEAIAQSVNSATNKH